jgi:hypothetical protein
MVQGMNVPVTASSHAGALYQHVNERLRVTQEGEACLTPTIRYITYERLGFVFIDTKICELCKDTVNDFMNLCFSYSHFRVKNYE